MIYFDHNATTPLLPEAAQTWLQASQTYIGNPSSPHRLGARSEAALEDVRERLANTLGCDALDIVWTSGATESNNMVWHHLARCLKESSEAWVSAIEHPCVLEAAQYFLPGMHRIIPVTHGGIVDLNWLSNRLKKTRPAMVAVMAANNETGVLQPWREVLALCQEREVPCFCDAAQWVGKLPAFGLGRCDFVSGCAHKFGGPKGVGFLKCPAKGSIQPLLVGGRQEEGRRAGTENVAGVLAMMAALELRQAELGSVHQAEASDTSEPAVPPPVQARLDWRNDFVQRVLEALPGAEIVGSGQARLWNTVSSVMPAADCQQRWVVKLDKLGFAVSTGSACSSGQEKPSHVLAAMGYSPAQTSRVLRFSSGWETTVADWDRLLDALRTVHQMMSCN